MSLRLSLAGFVNRDQLLDGIEDDGKLFVVLPSSASILRAGSRFESIAARDPGARGGVHRTFETIVGQALREVRGPRPRTRLAAHA
jgi:hypothetical protein